jgi:hypothetical protein
VERIGRTKRQIQTAQKHGRGSQVTGRHLDPLQSRNQAIEAIERRSSFACAELLGPDPPRGSRCKLGGGESLTINPAECCLANRSARSLRGSGLTSAISALVSR